MEASASVYSAAGASSALPFAIAASALVLLSAGSDSEMAAW